MKIKLKKVLHLLIVFSLVLSSLYSPIGVSAEEETPALTPFTDHTIPGFIATCDFDYGGVKVAYSEPWETSKDDGYREDAEILNFYKFDEGVVMSFSGSEWMKYTVNIEKTARYEVSVAYATYVESNTLTINVDGKNTTSFQLLPTGDSQKIVTNYVGLIELEEGEHVLTFTLTTGWCNIRGYTFKEHIERFSTDYKKQTGPFRYSEAPALIQAENFDMGEGGSHSRDGVNQSGFYRPDDPIDISDSTTGYRVVLAGGDWVNYTVDVANTAPYSISVNGIGSGEVFIDDIATGLPFKCDDYGFGKAENVLLTEGTHTIKIKSDYLDMDYIRVDAAKGDYLTSSEVESYIPPAPVEIDKNAVQTEIYVAPDGDDSNAGTKESPFKTMDRAREEARKYNDDMTGNIIVHFAPGYYQLDEMVMFSEEDSGTNGYSIIYKGDSATESTLISGGTKITGWEKTADGHIWKAKTNIEDTRNLYINGLPAQRALSKYRYMAVANLEPTEERNSDPNNKATQPADVKSYGIKVTKQDIFLDFEHPEEVELVWPIDWAHQRCPVKDIYEDPDNPALVVFEMDMPYWEWYNTKDAAFTNPIAWDSYPDVLNGESFYIENAKALLDEPGEFYFDKTTKEIYYYPYAQEDLTTAETYAATTEFMVQVMGTSATSRVRNITFDNLDFRYGAWNEVNETGISITQTDHIVNHRRNIVTYGGRVMPGQFTVNFSDNVNILNCEFRCLGSSAIVMNNGVSNSTVQGNKLMDISGTGIMVDSYESRGILRPGQVRCDNILVANNVIHRPANQYYGMVGISMYMPSNTIIRNNDINDTPYSGIIAGWGWGNAEAVASANCQIVNNKIYDVTSILRDGGHIYTLDRVQDLQIAYNYLDKATDWRGGIYLDSGSRSYDIHHNVVSDTYHWFFGRTDVKIKDIELYDNFYDTKSISTIDRANITTSNNTAVERGEDGVPQWPQEALDIIANAGLEDEYKHLLEGTELPSWRTDVLDTMPVGLYADSNSLWIQAEDWTKGADGQGVNYFTQLVPEPKTYADSKRTAVGTVTGGDWFRYDLNLAKTMEYDVIIRASSAQPLEGPQPHATIYIDGEKVIDKQPIYHSGSWNDYLDYNVGKVTVTAGKHDVKVVMEENGFSFDCFGFFNDSYFAGMEYDEGKIVEQDGTVVDTATTGATFQDIVGHWAEKDITDLAGKGVIKGVSATHFAPEETLSYYQAVWLVARCLGIDTSSDTWKQDVEAAGLMKAITEDGTITREEFAYVLTQGYKKAKNLFELETFPNYFHDSSQIAAEYKQAVGAAVKLGFIIGDEDGKFNPKGNLTRAEAATMISRFNNGLK